MENYTDDLQRILAETEKDKKTELLLRDLKLTALPTEIRKMTWLKKLIITGCQINKIEGLEELKNLEYLDLSGNYLSSIQGLEELSNLRILVLSSNQIIKIDGLSKLQNLASLYLDNNKITRIEGLSELTNLDTLELAGNQIDKLEDLGNLPELTNLDLSNNKIGFIENSWDQLPKLERLYLLGNELKTLLSLLPLLKTGFGIHNDYILPIKVLDKLIFVQGNPLSEPPIEIIDQGSDAILKYFNELKLYEYEKLEILKIILVGNSQVGKSNFSQFLRKGTINIKTKSTHVLDIQICYADFLISEKGTKTRLHLFDFGGQDYYHDSYRMYYSHDTAYILLWDTVSNEYQEKTEAINEDKDTILYENFPLPYWLQSINYTLDGKYVDTYAQPGNNTVASSQTPKAKEPPILVIQNKIDIANGHLNQEKLSLQYPNIWGYFGVSLLMKKRTKVLKELISDYLRSLNLAGRILLSYQMDIVNHFTNNIKKELKIYTLREFKDTCISIINNNAVVFEERDALIMAQILNNIGIILFYQDKEEPVIFTDISLLNEQIKKIMAYAKEGNDKGVFKKEVILKDKDIIDDEKILELLCNNKSIIKLNDQEYLAPQFLPLDADNSIKFFLHTFNYIQVRYEYPAYYHKSILLNLFAEYVTRSKDKISLTYGTFPFWRNGIIFSRGEGIDKELVYVEFVKNKTNAVINIRTMLPFSRQRLEGEIDDLIHKLNTGWKAERNVSVDNNIFISVDKLTEKFTTKQFQFVHEKKPFRINDFKELVHFENRPQRIFISYSSLDKEYLKQFTIQMITLRNEGLVETWDDRELMAGENWDVIIKDQLSKADYVILFITANFLNSEYIREVELKESLKNNKRIIPIIIDYCSWKDDENIKDIQVLNKDNPLVSYNPISKGWVDVVKGFKDILERKN